MTTFDLTLAATVGSGDRRLIQQFQADLAGGRHMAWMRWYYPNLDGMASAVAYGCPVFCRYCFVDPALKYPKAAANLVENLRKEYPHADYYSGVQVVERLARLAKKWPTIANRLAQTELFLTPAFALEFIGATIASTRHLAIESTCLELGSNKELAKDFQKLVAKAPEKVRVTAHILAPSAELIHELVGRPTEDFQNNLNGVAAVAATAVELHPVFVAFRPPQVSEEKWAASLRHLFEQLTAVGIDPASVELRPTRAYGDTLPILQKQYPTANITRATFKTEFANTLNAWQQLVPGYQLPYAGAL